MSFFVSPNPTPTKNVENGVHRQTRRSYDGVAALSRWLTCLILLCIFALGFSSTSRAAHQVAASLTMNKIELGDTTQLSVEITLDSGGLREGLRPPQEIRVDGLEIGFAGSQQSTNMVNSVVTRRVTLIYAVTGQRIGKYIIPPIEVGVDKDTLRTQQLELEVITPQPIPGAPPPQPGQAQSADAQSHVAWAELHPSKTTLYEGEAMQMELRLYVRQGVGLGINGVVDVPGDGLSKSRMPNPQITQVQRGGLPYQVFFWRQTVIPNKAGKIKIGPGKVPTQMSIPVDEPRRRQRSLFDQFIGGTSFKTEEKDIVTEEIELDVKPLPVAGRPASFSGAVGNFRLETKATPLNVKLGDPITMNFFVAGNGSFDRVNAPVAVPEPGWQHYPGREQFNGDNQLMTSGAKQFEVAVAPEAAHTQTPAFEFSFFDPAAEKYVTLAAERFPITVTGAPAPAPQPSVAVGPSTSAKPGGAASAFPAEKPALDPSQIPIGSLLPKAGPLATFTPVYLRPGFLYAQLVPFSLLAFWFAWRATRPSAEQAARRALEHEASRALSALGDAREDAEFLEKAAHALQLHSALRLGGEPTQITAATIIADRQPDPATRECIEELFAYRDDAIYGGGTRTKLNPDRRQRLHAAVKTICAK